MLFAPTIDRRPAVLRTSVAASPLALRFTAAVRPQTSRASHVCRGFAACPAIHGHRTGAELCYLRQRSTSDQPCFARLSRLRRLPCDSRPLFDRPAVLRTSVAASPLALRFTAAVRPQTSRASHVCRGFAASVCGDQWHSCFAGKRESGLHPCVQARGCSPLSLYS